MKKLQTLLLILATMVAVAPSSTVTMASANDDDFSLGQGGTQIDYNPEPTGGDYAWVRVEKDYRLTVNGTIYKADTSYVIIGFDAPEIETITRMGFYVTYRDPNFIHQIGNWWEVLWGNQPKYGDIKTDTSLVQASTVYSFMDKNNLYDVEDPDSTRYEFNAIGRVENLLVAEANYRNDITGSNNMWPGYAITGGYVFNYNASHSLNDTSKSFTSREFYAIVPYAWTEEVQPEAIKAFSFDGTMIDDGLDENGNPFIDTQTGLYYIDVVVGKNAGIAVNGLNAVVKTIKVSGYANGNDTAVMIDNGDFDYATQSVVNSANKRLFLTNEEFTANWSITNNNRYIMIKYMSDSVETAQEITVRIYYTNSNEKAAWLVNIKGELGFLPPPYETPPVVDTSANGLSRILQLFLFAVIGIGAIFVIVFLLDFAFKIRNWIR